MQDYFLTSEEDSKEYYTKLIERTVKNITSSIKNDKAYKGLTPFELKKIIKKESILPQKGLGWDTVEKELKEKVLPNLLRTPSSDYMAHLHGPSLTESIASELIISTFNQSMDSWDQSPVATEIEVETIKTLCALYGYSDKADGVFTSGGSQSNQTAIILARDSFCKNILKHDVQKNGLPKNFSKLRMYTSEISHFSMEKSAIILGLGSSCVVKVPVDSKKKMDIKALSSLIDEDKKNGNIPFLIVATVGTTDFGSIDPLEDLHKIAEKNKMWLHADAAYGSGVIMSEKYNNRVTALKNCDSITVDFHKMFLMTISCSAVLIKDGKNFDFLTIRADYLNRKEDEEDGYTNLVDKSLQTTRRFDALKVWTSFQVRGKEGWSKIIESSMDNALYLYNILKNDEDFQVLCEPEISSLVFRFILKEELKSDEKLTGKINKNLALKNKIKNIGQREDEINKSIRRTLIHQHGIVIGQTASQGRVFLKFTLLNPLITHKKLDELKLLIKNLAKENIEL